MNSCIALKKILFVLLTCSVLFAQPAAANGNSAVDGCQDAVDEVACIDREIQQIASRIDRAPENKAPAVEETDTCNRGDRSGSVADVFEGITSCKIALMQKKR